MPNKPYKPRTESAELLILKSLNTRMNLSDKDKQHYFNLKKGYEGEIMFDLLTEKLQCECFILNDLLLKVNNTMFQIDSMIIISETIYFYEVKNYEGDYYFELDRFYKKPKFEINNPLHQLNRSESLLRQLLSNLGYNIPINASVVFINPEFTLYQSPLNKPLIFPTQVNRYLKTLNTTPSILNRKHKILADKLISLHIDNPPFKQLPPYEYDHLQKGITCSDCSSFSISVEGKNCVCKECGHEEAITNAVMRNVKEFKLLFPNLKITTNVIYEWCTGVVSKKRIRKILEKSFKIVGVHQWSYYE
jgi:Nuclease-related domain